MTKGLVALIVFSQGMMAHNVVKRIVWKPAFDWPGEENIRNGYLKISSVQGPHAANLMPLKRSGPWIHLVSSQGF